MEQIAQLWDNLRHVMDSYRNDVVECPLLVIIFAERVAQEHETAKLLAEIHTKVVGIQAELMRDGR